MIDALRTHVSLATRDRIKRIALVIALVVIPLTAPFVVILGYIWSTNAFDNKIREGHTIVDVIHEHDPSIKALWTSDGHGHPNVVIREVFDPAKQDEIISWAKAAKAQGRIQHHIVIDFQHEIPHSSPDIILREVEF